MALQVSTGPNSLVALGISVGDVATLYGLAKRIGNWLTAASGDQEFLELLDQDEMDIFRRKGLIDILRFNKKWGSKMTILANSKPTSFVGKDAEKNLDRFSRFTAIMVCTIAALEAFATRETVRLVLKGVLLALLQTSQYGEDVLASYFANRANSWQSAADVRGLSGKARQIRQSLLSRNVILEGLMPDGDAKPMVDFLVWLFAGNTPTYVTPSSDVAGVAACLSKLGIDILSVVGLGEESPTTSCQLEYSPLAAFLSNALGEDTYIPSLTSRGAYTTVNLQALEESLTKFPVNAHTCNRCRQAWCSGSKAAEAVGWTLVYQGENSQSAEDIKYVFYDKGSENTRTRTKIGALVEAHAFVINREVCQELESILHRESDTTLAWLLDQTVESFNTDDMVSSVDFQDQQRINAFTVFQAFFMGYYYAIFLRLIDTSELQLKVVDGHWGYRSLKFLTNMRTVYLSEFQFEEQGTLVFRREDVISILSSLVCGTEKMITRIRRHSSDRDPWCVGIVGKQTILVRSLLKPCQSISDIGKFVLLDIDVSGIPRDIDGLVRPGVADGDQFYRPEPPSDVVTETLNEDVSFHIEADWAGDPNTMLICVRYKGRRALTLNPAVADKAFCLSTIPSSLRETSHAEVTVTKLAARDCLNRRKLKLQNRKSSYVLHVASMPRLCYAILYWYHQDHMVRLANSFLDASVQYTKKEAERRKYLSYIVIASGSECCPPEDEIPAKYLEEIERIGTKRNLRRPGGKATILGDDRTRALSYNESSTCPGEGL